MTSPSKLLLLAGALALSFASASSHAAVVFDNISAVEAGVPGATVTSTGSTPNTFMGDAYTLSAGTTSITGFDLYPGNLSGTNFTGLKINLYVWGGVNTGTVAAATPAFSNLLGSYSFTATGTYNSGFYYSFENAVAGSAPGVVLPTALTIPTTTIGVTVNVQGTTDGVTYSNFNSLTSMIAYGAAPTVGSTVFNGYYRNAASEVNGNFTSTLRNLAGLTNQSLAMRVYGTVSAVPEPSTYALMLAGMIGIGFIARRRPQQP